MEACNGIYGNIEGYLDTLYSSDVLIIEDINYLSRQLKGGSLAKKTLCQLLDRRSLSDKLLILTVDSSGDGITDDGLNARFKEFHAVTIGQQNKALLQKWLHNILSDADFRLNARDADALVASSTSVRELKNCLLRWLAEHTDLYRHLIPGLPKKETEMIV